MIEELASFSRFSAESVTILSARIVCGDEAVATFAIENLDGEELHRLMEQHPSQARSIMQSYMDGKV